LIGQIVRRLKPLVALLHLVTHPRPPRLPEPREHRPCAGLLAHLALPPHLDASARLLQHRLFEYFLNIKHEFIIILEAGNCEGGALSLSLTSQARLI